jgi:DNA-binding winged helix-turn-helix (wHTH) protein/predicted ATPase
MIGQRISTGKSGMLIPSTRLCFPPFELDLATSTLWRGTQRYRLKPQAAAVLCYLVEHAGQVVSKDELLAALWPDVHVHPGVLKTLIWELRQVLHDQPKAPRFIETLPRRGYRFIGPLRREPQAGASGVPPVKLGGPAGLVGRQAELALLHGRLLRALAGERQVVFVTGEAGIGKTTLVAAFLAQLVGRTEVWIARGQCVEHYGAGEAYLPVLEALGRLGREASRPRLVRLLRRYAPTWLAQLPALLRAPERDRLQRAATGVTRERMLRELAEAVEVLTAQTGLVLWFEDIQWSDPSTLEWLGYVARRPGLARLLVVGTCRPAAMLAPTHPLRVLTQELPLHGQGVELVLRGITEEDIAEYLCGRLQSREKAPLHALARAVHQRTEGNPLFMVHVVEYLLAQGALVQCAGQWDVQSALALVQRGVPQRIHEMVERQLAQLSPEEQRVLEVASVAGAEFSAAAVAAGLTTTVEEVEEQCAGLARRALFVQPCGRTEWPDGTVAARYAFLHTLYAHVLYERLPAGRCRALHARLGWRLEQAYGTQTRDVAAELALHFERGWEYSRAVYHLRQAGENASRRGAHAEAMHLLTKGLELLQRLPETPERARQELQLQMALGTSLIVVKGYAGPELEKVYRRAQALCQQLGETRGLFSALLGLCALHHNRAEFRQARDLAEHMLHLAQREESSTCQLWAQVLLAQVLYQSGAFDPAHKHYMQAIALYDSQRHSPHVSDVVHDPRVHCLAMLAEVLWWRGYPAQARQRSQEVLTLAQRLAHAHSRVVALTSVVQVHSWRGEHRVVREFAEEQITLARAHGFPHWLAVGVFRRGWAVAAQGHVAAGIAQMRQGLAAFQATGAHIALLGFWCDLVWAHGIAGQVDEGLALIADALTWVQNTGEYYYAAELYRLKGELLLQSGIQRPGSGVLTPDAGFQTQDAEAEACFRKAITLARRQRTVSLELRAALSLSRLWRQQGKLQQARQMLAQVYSRFTEGFDTADLQEAKALLDALT